MSFLDHSFFTKDYFLPSILQNIFFPFISNEINEFKNKNIKSDENETIYKEEKNHLKKHVKNFNLTNLFFIGKKNSDGFIYEIKKVATSQKEFLNKIDFYCKEFDNSVEEEQVLISYCFQSTKSDFSLFKEKVHGLQISWYDFESSLEKIALPIFYSHKKSKKLKEQSILKLLSSNGIFAQNIEDFESRNSQQQMIRGIVSALNEEKHYICEAPTGTGKSFAYLLPCFYWSKINRQRVLISTNTIALQKQLMEKDIPFLKKILSFDLKISLVKGRNNYLCPNKMAKMQLESYGILQNEEDKREFKAIEDWALKTKTGDKQDLPFLPKEKIWQMFCSDDDFCKCKIGENCFYMQQKSKFLQADILIANHHIVCADLAIKKETQQFDKNGLLPPYQYIVIDEAHHFENSALSYFGEKSSNRMIHHYISRMIQFHEKDTKKGKEGDLKGGLLFILNRLFVNQFSQSKRDEWFRLIKDYFSFFNREYKSQENKILTHLYAYLNHVDPKNSEKKQRIKKEIFQTSANDKNNTQISWQKSYIPAMKSYISLLEKMLIFFENINNFLENQASYQQNENQEEIQDAFFRFQRYLSFLKNIKENFIQTIKLEVQEEIVSWISIEKKKNYLFATHFCPLQIGDILHDNLFSKNKVCMVTSATLSLSAREKSFEYFQKNIGLEKTSVEKKLTENLPSVFDYEKNSCLYLPFQNSRQNYGQKNTQQNSFLFIKHTTKAEIIMKLIRYFEGKTMILLTSYEDLNFYKKYLFYPCQQENISLLCQGEEDRNQLMERFKTEKSVLLGVSSFWEGIDIKGKSLSCLIMPKLPFDVPTEPMHEAKSEFFKKQGIDPFLNYSLPNAIIKFKQGFGRLIRSQKDKGVFALLDERITQKRYGKYFIHSLPRMTIVNSMNFE